MPGQEELSPGWATDLAVLLHTGSVVEHHDDHLVLRTPAVPSFHWGNCVLVTDADATADAARWVRTFEAAFPAANWVAVGLPTLPDAEAPWTAFGLELEIDDALVAHRQPRLSPCPDGYHVRELEGDDWEQVIEQAAAENARTWQYEPAGHERFLRQRTAQRRELCARGLAAFFGAFTGEALAASLGIVRCGHRARFQDVGTEMAHRRRGLATHLLGVAAAWAGERGCSEWVIVTDAENPAGRVYRAVGFEPALGGVCAYRRPPH